MSASPQIVVVGSFVQDLTFHCSEFPRPGETVIGEFFTGPGGKGSNQAVAAARAGSRVAFVGAVGRDAFAAGARAFHEAEGIACLAAEKAHWPTGAASILVNAHGQNQIVVSLGANAALAPADVNAQASCIRGAKVLIAQLEANLDATAHALRMAREAGLTVVLNPAPMRTDFDPAMLVNVDVLIPNETEFAALVKLDERTLATVSDVELHALCRGVGVPVLILTLGSRGCFISQPDGFCAVAAISGIKAVDTTGAGDAFVGAFATAFAEHEEVERAARFANAAAALSVTRNGTAPAMPYRAEIDALLGEPNGAV